MQDWNRWTAPITTTLATLAAAALLAQGCDSGAQGTVRRAPSSSGSSGSASSSGGPSSSGSSSSGASSSGATSSSSGGTSSGAASACAGQSFNGQRQPLDLYVMLDRSGSMKEYPAGEQSNKWQSVTAALSSFVQQPLEGTSVGLQYFGVPAASCGSTTCTRSSDCDACGGTCQAGSCRPNYQRGADSCSAADYAKPEVDIGPLTKTAPLITASMARQDPSTGTPTSAALQGAVDHARAWASAAQNAGHAVLVVLATDGDPTECDTDLDHINAIAAGGLSASPSVRTFVIGVGVLKENLDGIAKAGGSGAAYIVSTGSSVTDQFLKALNDIRGKTVGCSYAIPAPPAGQKLDFGLVNVEYQPGGGGAKVTLGKTANAGSCGASTHAWYYDDAAAPRSIVLCPSTCSTVEADATASVKIVLGCQSTGEW
jgi:hypothetical protein